MTSKATPAPAGHRLCTLSESLIAVQTSKGGLRDIKKTCWVQLYWAVSVITHIYTNLLIYLIMFCVVCVPFQEWLDLRCRGVRNANAYILVYDICCVESFEYVKMIRQQIVENRYRQLHVCNKDRLPSMVACFLISVCSDTFSNGATSGCDVWMCEPPEHRLVSYY